MAVVASGNNVVCEQCGSEYSGIGRHWGKSGECDWPQMSETKRQALVGMLMSDGGLQKFEQPNQYMKIGMTNKQFLEWFDKKLGWLSTGVSLEKTAEEHFEISKDGGAFPGKDSDNWNDMYGLRTRSHPQISELAKWYSSGSKVWPEDIEMSPTTLLFFFIGDGSYITSNGARYIQISANNEVGNQDKINNYFSRQNLPEPSRYKMSLGERSTPRWGVVESYKLFKHMQKSPWYEPEKMGFGYKFPSDLEGASKSMSDLSFLA